MPQAVLDNRHYSRDLFLSFVVRVELSFTLVKPASIVHSLSNIFSAGVYNLSIMICENDIFVYFYVS